jgi:hypothetical protein
MKNTQEADKIPPSVRYHRRVTLCGLRLQRVVTRNRKPLETAITYRVSRAKQDRTSKLVFRLSGETTPCFHGMSWPQCNDNDLF